MKIGAAKVWRNPVASALLLFAALFVIGLVTRMPARAFPALYALHGVLAAPFCAALAQWWFRRGGGAGPLLVGVCLLSVVLGVMSLAMGLGFALVCLVTLAAWLLLARAGAGTRRFVTAVVLGAADYPCAVVAGALLGSYGFSMESVPVMVILLLLSVALAVLGAALANLGRAAGAE